MQYQSLDQFIAYVRDRNPGQPEFHQAVHEVMYSLWPFIEANPRYKDAGLLETLVEPDRIIQFRVPWVDDQGRTRINRGYRVQHSSAIGPYKGGMRFHPSVNLSILKFLAFEQTFKNALTTLPLGGGKGGADFDPKGKSEGEIRRFCQSLVLELYRHVGPDTDVPAGDIGVGSREVGYMAGQYKRVTNTADSVFTGKGLSFGGSLIRPESTGYGLVYFCEEMLEKNGMSFEGQRVAVSGSGNVAQFAIEKLLSLGARVLTVSDSQGAVVDPNGINPAKLALLCEMRNVQGRPVKEFAEDLGLEYLPGARPWSVPVDVALPCATQNELEEEDARQLVANGVVCVGEGANMPCSHEATEVFRKAGVLFAPGKASNAGGVATSGFEMSQNAARLSWTREEVDERLRNVMRAIHESCVQYGKRDDGSVDYVNGANIAGFVKVADALLGQGWC